VTAVLTSATIPDNLAKNLGLDGDCVVEHFDSPFDYQQPLAAVRARQVPLAQRRRRGAGDRARSSSS
jgi:hypothetical protein